MYEPSDASHMRIVDILRLIGHLVVVLVQPRREEDDWDPVPGITPMVAPAVDTFGMTIGIEGVVELEWLLPLGLDLFDEVAERSEERRVGKECRRRWSQAYYIARSMS